MSAWKPASIFASAVLVACGEPLADGGYRGEPLLVVNGSVLTNYSPEELGWPDGELRVTLDWAQWAGDGGRTAYDAGELETFTSFPSRYRLHVYLPPPGEARYTPSWATGRRIAVGTPLLYIDRDGDDQWDYRDDPIVGGSEDVVVVYVEGDSPLSDGFVTLEPGFQVMYATIDYCTDVGAEAGDRFFPDATGPVNLLVGDLWNQLLGWAC
jgi:hypothetical protein